MWAAELIVPRLLADDEVASRANALEAGAVPENAIDRGSFGRVSGGEKDLNAVARPFGGSGVEVRRGKRGAALGPDFVKKNVAY